MGFVIDAGLPDSGDVLNLDDAQAVELWAKVFGIRPSDLRIAVQIAGASYDELVEFMSEKSW